MLNDLNQDIVTLYRVLQHHLEEFIRYFKWVLVSRDEFERWLRVAPDTLTDIQRAARFYYLQKLCFGGRMVNPSFGTATARPLRLNLLRIEEELSAAHLRPARVFVENLPYARVIEHYDRPTTFYYIDPPYLLAMRELLRKGAVQPGRFRAPGRTITTDPGTVYLELK